MKSSAIFTLSPPSFLSSRPNAKTKTLPLGTCMQRASQPTNLHCAKMFVPGFGEASPEAKAANNLHNFFTYIAVKIVAAQLEVTPQLCYFLAFILRLLWKLTKAWMACLCEPCETLHLLGTALRILEVRSAYCKNDFDWEKLKLEAAQRVDESNTMLMRDYVQETTHEK